MPTPERTHTIRLLVCGNRDWSCAGTIGAWLKRFPAGTLVICGVDPARPRGADGIAWELAETLGFDRQAFAADWVAHEKAAGPLRNRQMLTEGCPTHGLAFGRLTKPGRDYELTGTGDMVAVLNRGNVRVTVVPAPGVMP